MAGAALLVIDMQNFFAPMAKSALPNIKKLHSYFNTTLQAPIIFTQHGHPESDLTPPYTNQLVKRWGPSGSVAKGSKDWQLIPSIRALADSSDSSVVAKNTYDAFINTNLTELLEEKSIERLVICGVMTDCCCDTTARSAFNRGFDTWLVSDACGSADREQHEAGLKGFGFACGNVLITEEVIERLKAEP